MIRSFTGPSDLNDQEKAWVASVILGLQNRDPAALWRSGTAYGVDTIVARLAEVFSIPFELYVPVARHNDSLVEEQKDLANAVIYAPARVSTSDSYRIRNKLLVEGSDQLLAFVWQPNEEFYRSGEWMTINIAKQYEVPTTIVQILNGR